MKKIILLLLSFLCLTVFSGCSREKVFIFPKEKVQSFSVYTYDTVSNTTTSNWVYLEEDMVNFLTYLDKLTGTKVDTLDTATLSSPFYGIELNVDNPYTLLFIGDYAITYDGAYYKIDSRKAQEMCRSIIGATDVHEGTSYIANQRYLSLLSGEWDTTYMIASSYTGTPLENASMTSEKASIDTSLEKLGITIDNHTGSTLEFGSKLDLEVMVDGIWYNIDNMINDNVAIGWNSLLYMLDSGITHEDNYYLKYHQPLPSGPYRIVKSIRADGVDRYLACEFLVE